MNTFIVIVHMVKTKNPNISKSELGWEVAHYLDKYLKKKERA